MLTNYRDNIVDRDSFNTTLMFSIYCGCVLSHLRIFIMFSSNELLVVTSLIHLLEVDGAKISSIFICFLQHNLYITATYV